MVEQVEGIEKKSGVRMERARQGGHREVWEVSRLPRVLVHWDKGGPICLVM